MTSSLVGSEMCIRDRKQHRLKRKARRSPKETNKHAKPWDSQKEPGSLSCLLYTSDAADDM
eukprot:6471573-Prorocentrum_lima.AAC.1